MMIVSSLYIPIVFHCRNKLKSIPVLVHRQHAPLFAQPKTDQITFRQAITMEIRCDRFMGENLQNIHRCISKHTTGMDVCILGKPISCLNPIRVFLFLRSLTWLEVQVQCLPIGRAIRPWIAVRRRMEGHQFETETNAEDGHHVSGVVHVSGDFEDVPTGGHIAARLVEPNGSAGN